MRVALITEGTYPHSHGGVSVWCDQLITGLPEFDFDVYAVVPTGVEVPSWQPPPNVSGLTVSALWGTQSMKSWSRQEFKEFTRCVGTPN